MSDFLIFIGSCLCVIIVIVGLIQKFWLVFIRPGYVGVLQKPGKSPSLIKEGFNLIKYPWERLASYHWTYNEEQPNGKSRLAVFTGNQVYTRNITMNPSGVKCKTRTGIIVNVNGVFTFVIDDPIKAVTSMPDLYNFLEICIKNATVQAVLNYSHDEIIGSNYHLARTIRDAFEKQVLEYGVQCSEYIIEDITMNESIMNARQTEIIKASEHKLMIEDARRKAETKALQEQSQYELEIKKQQLEMQKIMSENEVTRSRQACELEMEKRKLEIEEIKANQEIMKQRSNEHENETVNRLLEQHIEHLGSRGFSPRDIIDFLSRDSILEAAKQTDKWIVGGADFAKMLSGSFYQHQN